MQQRIANPRLKWWQGILLIVGIVVMLMAFQFIAAVVSYMLGDKDNHGVASLVFWFFGGVVAVALLRRYIMEYQYTVSGLNFEVARVYGRMKPRAAVTIVTRSIVDIGTPEEIEGKFPGSHPRTYLRGASELPVRAVAYESDGRIKVIHIQPNDEILEKLRGSIEKKK